MRNIRLLVAYDGTEFHGWQRQPGLATIQGCIESALEQIVLERVTAIGSGRTDAGVHALGQVANFNTMCPIPCSNLVKALNNLLPSTIRVIRARTVAKSFHACYDARSKTYRYRILLAPVAMPFLGRFVYHHPYPLDRKRMAAAARRLEGEHDFTSFAASERGEGPALANLPVREGNPPCSGPAFRAPSADKRSSVRKIFSSRILWHRRTSVLVYEVRGSGFLHHMVRNIIGTLIEVGRGKLSPTDIIAILEAHDRNRAGPTAPATGLCLVKVEY